jgi:hypothetical protein
MKPKNSSRLLFYGITLLVGVMIGALVQKVFGFGNVLRTIGIPYPTSAPPAESAIVPAVDIPQVHRGQMSLFILAGQSNMIGWAPVPQGEKSDSRIYVFGNDYRWRIAREPIDDAYDQVDQVSEDDTVGFGPSLAFALASLDRYPQLVIGLIPCARNSSAIGQWQRDLSDQSLYGSCLKRARAASPMGQISGILFFQGETDALDSIQYADLEPNPTDWSRLFTVFITDFRRDLNTPYLPVVFAQLGPKTPPEAFANWDVVKEQQRSVQLPVTAMILTDDLPLMDGLHFTTESYRTIGKRFADAYWDLVEQQLIK